MNRKEYLCLRYAGDYPDLGVVTYDHKDPYESWTDRNHRRNWGEMVSVLLFLNVLSKLILDLFVDALWLVFRVSLLK